MVGLMDSICMCGHGSGSGSVLGSENIGIFSCSDLRSHWSKQNQSPRGRRHHCVGSCSGCLKCFLTLGDGLRPQDVMSVQSVNALDTNCH